MNKEDQLKTIHKDVVEALLENSIQDIFNKEIVRELLLEINGYIYETDVDRIWPLCKGNPWNAPFLYKLLAMGLK